MSPFDTEPMMFCSNYVSISCRLWDIQCRKIMWPWNPSQRSIKIIESGRLLMLYIVTLSLVPFWDIRLVVTQWPWNPSYGSLKIIGAVTYRSATYDFLLTFHNNHAPISYRFRDKRRFQSKIAKFSHPVYFAPLLKGFPLELGIGAGSKTKTRMMGLPDQERCLTISWAIWIQSTNVTVRRTDTGRQQKPHFA